MEYTNTWLNMSEMAVSAIWGTPIYWCVHLFRIEPIGPNIKHKNAAGRTIIDLGNTPQNQKN